MKPRQGRVFVRGVLAAELEESRGRYRFTYDAGYLADPAAVAVSLTLPLRREPYESEVLFPFFQSLLAEGTTKRAQCRQLKLDENDSFGRLLATAHDDVIGAVTVRPAESS